MQKHIKTTAHAVLLFALVLVPLALFITFVPWPGLTKQAHAATISCPPLITSLIT